MENRQELTGLVIKAPFALGSKSEHEAILLDTGDKRYVLRREGGNAFFDPVLEQLVGRKSEAQDGSPAIRSCCPTGPRFAIPLIAKCP
jgi:hypothetical protein